MRTPNHKISTAAFILTCIIAFCAQPMQANADVDTLLIKAMIGRKAVFERKDGSEIKGIARAVSPQAVVIEKENGDLVKLDRRTLEKLRAARKRIAPRKYRDRSKRERSKRGRSKRYRSGSDRPKGDQSDRDGSDRDGSDRDSSDRDRSKRNRSDRDRSDRDRSDRDRSDRDRSDRDDSDRRSHRGRPSYREPSAVYNAQPHLSQRIVLSNKLAAARQMRNAGIVLTSVGLGINLIGTIITFSSPSVGTIIAGLLVMGPVGGATWITGAPLWGVGNARMAKIQRKMAIGRKYSSLTPPVDSASTTLLQAQ